MTCSGGCSPPTWTSGAIAAGAWLAAAAITHFLPDIDDFRTHRAARERHGHTRPGLALLTFGCRLLGIRPPERISRTGPWLILLAASFAAWELVTAKFAVLPRPFFASPQALLEVFTDDYPNLGDSVWHSLTLLAGGYAIGAACGFIAGVAIGWSRTVGYWEHPVLRLIEPLHRLAAAAILCLPVQPQRQHVPDRPGDRLPGHRADLVRRRQRQSRLLRRGANDGCLAALPRAAGGGTGGDAIGVRRPVHGAWRIVLGAGCGRNDGRQIRSRLVLAMGAGLGGPGAPCATTRRSDCRRAA